jgi:hypothetical protein
MLENLVKKLQDVLEREDGCPGGEKHGSTTPMLRISPVETS